MKRPSFVSVGYSCPALAAVNSPVEISSTPSQTVTNISSGLFAQIWRLTASSVSAGESPDVAWFFTRILAIIMNSAAGMPLPETSAITTAKWSSSTMKKS